MLCNGHVQLYNEEKPHINLKRKTPCEFEKHYICTHTQKSEEGEGRSIAPFLSKENLKKNSSTNLIKTVNAI